MDKIDTTVVTEFRQLPDVFHATFGQWNRNRGTAWAPKWRDFPLDDLEPSILPWSIVVDVETSPPDFRFRFWGTERTNLIGAEMTGRKISEIDNPKMRDANVLEYLEVCRLRKPILCDTPVTKGSGLPAVFQTLRLPLSEDGQSVTHVFSSVNYRQISTDHYDVYGTTPDTRVPKP